eukprot:TRINITY_DN85084_c0_g1_i1.p2 TRINITY_DN85084_c0_g1~~TRINITY_DN85084_c0_g1_i1.p2  ORF type:complete len:345 (-),score=10.52 TRINITY_DN85084_c0_g1_i1:1912-2826(-)
MSEFTKVLDDYYRVKPNREPKVKSLKLDYSSCGYFQSFLRMSDFKIQRCGILFGRVKDDEVWVDSIYEPAQHGTPSGHTELEDPNLPAITEMASMMGLKPVGHIFSHPPRDYVLSGQEVLRTARAQTEWGPHAVCVVVAVDPEAGEVNFEAYQVSDQCVTMYNKQFDKKDLLSPHPDKPDFIKASMKVQAATEGGSYKETDEMESILFLAPVAIESHETDLLRNSFVHMNRPDYVPSMSDLKRFLKDPKVKDLPFWQQLQDFHILAFLCTALDVKTDLPLICTSIITKDSSAIENYRVIIDACD